MTTFYVRPRGVRQSEEVIERSRLDTLRRLARRGADYEAAARGMRSKHAEVLERYIRAPNEYDRGWLAAMREFAEAVVGGAVE